MCEHWGDPAPLQHRYSLVLDREGGVLLRVAGMDERRRHATLGPLGVPVDQASTAFSDAKGYRRRWPEAFGWAHAHTVLTGIGLFGASVVLAGTVERLLGA